MRIFRFAGWIAIGAAIIPAAIADGCRTRTGMHTSPVLARVGDAELTIGEARQHVDTSRADVEVQIRGYASSWVNAELMFLEAKRLGIDRSDQFADQVAEVQRQLAGQLLLERTVYDDSLGISEDTLHAYYAAHASEFFVRADMVKLNVVTFTNRERASAFAGHVSEGAGWSSALSEVRNDSVNSSSLVSSVSDEYFTARTLFPQELWKVAMALGVNEVSFPVKLRGGFAVVQSVGSLKQGAPASFELARDEVRQRFLLGHRRQRYERMLQELRKRYPVQLYVDSHDSSEAGHAHE